MNYWDNRRIKEEKIRYADLIIKIFNEFDELINNSKSKNPVPFDESRFKKEYEKLKEKWLK